MNYISCYHCGVSETTLYAIENGYDLVKCSGCGLLYVNPRPDDQDVEEAHRYGTHRGKETISTTGWFHFEKVKEYRQVLRDFYPEGFVGQNLKWLDIGCGYGEFLLALKKTGNIDALGIEPNVLKQKSARKRGLNVQFLDLATHETKYDVVSLLNVFSHLPDPPAAIAGWKRLLKPGGRFLLQTGDTANTAPGDYHRPFYLPDHLSFASEKIVSDMLDRLGFEIISVRKYPYIRPSLTSFAKESIKLFWPGRPSKMRHLLQYRQHITDMYVLAKERV